MHFIGAGWQLDGGEKPEMKAQERKDEEKKMSDQRNFIHTYMHVYIVAMHVWRTAINQSIFL